MSASHVGREQTITVNGKAYRLGRLRRKEWREFHEWALSCLPNVLEILAGQIEKYPANLQPLMASEAVQMVNEPIERRTSALVDTPNGWAKLVHILLQEHHPGISEDEAWDVSVEMKSQMLDIITKAEGKQEGKGLGGETVVFHGDVSTDSSPKNTD